MYGACPCLTHLSPAPHTHLVQKRKETVNFNFQGARYFAFRLFYSDVSLSQCVVVRTDAWPRAVSTSVHIEVLPRAVRAARGVREHDERARDISGVLP